MLKLAALGALGYAGYKYFQKTRSDTDGRVRERAVAGGPLSPQATLQPTPIPPA